MLIDSSHRPWFYATVVLFLIALGAYVPYHLNALNGASGGTWPGLAYGAAGTAFMFFAGFIGLRRKFPRLPIGRAQVWLKGHIWLGLLAYPLILFHSGMRIGGPLTTVLMVLFTIVVLTGMFGLIVQAIVPRLMTMQVPYETIYSQVEHVTQGLLREAEEEVSAVCGPVGSVATKEHGSEEKKGKGKGKQAPKPLPGSGHLRDFFIQEVRTYLLGTKLQAFSSTTRRAARFQQVRVLVPPPLHATLALLEEICEERRQILHQRTLHHWLHGWIFIHLPASAALLALSVVHAVMALHY